VMMEPAELGLSSGLSTCACFFLDLLQDLTGAILPVTGDVLLDSEAPQC
jgi:hypothetical protein